MPVQFKNYPVTGNRLPGVYAEVDASRANTGTASLRTIVFGQVLAANVTAGTVVPNVPILCQGVNATRALAGNGSILAMKVYRQRQIDSFGEIWLMPLADDGAAVAATGAILINTVPTAAGTFVLYMAGERVLQAVTASMATTALATALAATINAWPNLPVTATVSSSTVTVTARNKGACGNDIDIRANYGGAPAGEATPVGLTYTITAMAGGATNPVLTTAIGNLGDTPFEFYDVPFNDTTSLTAIEGLFNDVSGRWSWQSMQYGHAFAAFRGTVGASTTFGLSRNSQHVTVMPFNDSPTPYWLWASDICAAAAVSVRADPGLPFQTLALNVLAPPSQSRFIQTDRNTLLFDGMSTFTVAQDGTVQIERLVTTYQINPSGFADNSYLDAETMFQLPDMIRILRSYLGTTFARKKLVSDATFAPPGSNSVNAPMIKAAIIAKYREMEFNGKVQNSAIFAANLIVENAGNGLVRVLLPADLANQLRQIAVLVQFLKS